MLPSYLVTYLVLIEVEISRRQALVSFFVYPLGQHRTYVLHTHLNIIQQYKYMLYEPFVPIHLKHHFYLGIKSIISKIILDMFLGWQENKRRELT